MITVDARGDVCPVPVVKTKEAIKGLNGTGELEVVVDNETAVQNLEKMAKQKGYEVTSKKVTDKEYHIIMKIDESKPIETVETERLSDIASGEKKVVVGIGSDKMGVGSEELGKQLLKGFIFAQTQLETLPDKIIFYNSGAKMTSEGSASLEDLKKLEAAGVEIMTCGTCLNHYGLTEKLMIGSVTNMYAIAEAFAKADTVIKP